MMKTTTFTSLALASLLSSTANAGSIDLGVSQRVNATGLYAADEDAHYPEWRYKNIFSSVGEGGINFFYKDNGFKLDWGYSKVTPAIQKLLVKIRPYTYGVDAPIDGDKAGRMYVNGSIDNANKSGLLVIGSRLYNDTRPNIAKPITDQSPVLFVAAGNTLKVGETNSTVQGITFNFSNLEHPDDILHGMTTPETKIKLDIRGTYEGNITLVHNDGSAFNTSDSDGQVLLWANVEGTMKSTIRLENRTAQIVADADPTKPSNLVEKYQTRDSAKINRLYINGINNGRAGNPLRIISEQGTSTFIEFGNGNKGGSELTIVSDSSNKYGTNERLTPTLVKVNNPNFHLGNLVANKSGTIIADMNGGEIGNIGFGTWYSDGIHYPSEGGAIIIQSKGILKYTGKVLTNSSSNDVTFVDRSGSAGGTIFDMRSPLDTVRWNFVIGKNNTIKLGGQVTLMDKLTSGEISQTLVKPANTHIVFDKGLNKQMLLRIGNGVISSGLDYAVINGGLKIETNVNSNFADIVAINNTIGYRDVAQTINLIPRVSSSQDYKSAVGKIVGYSSKSGKGDVNFAKYIEWMPDDGIINPATGGFVIELTSKDYGGDTNYKEWYISKYKLKSDNEITPPTKPDPEPEKPDPKPPVEKPEPTPDPKPPVTEPEKPVEPTPNPNPEPTPPAEPEKPKPPVTETPDEKPIIPDVKPPVTEPEEPKPPVEKPDNGQKPEEKPQVPVNPFSEKFIADVSASVGMSKSLFLANFNSINKRLGDLRGQDAEHGVWSRTFVGGYDSSTFWTLQAGYDNLVLKKDNFNLYVGAALSYAKDNITDMVEGVFYTSLIQDSGWYNDTLIKGAYMTSKTPLSKLNHYGFVISDEVGYRFRVNNFFIDPQVELSFGYMTGGSLKDYYNGSVVDMSFSNTFHFRGRAGSTFGYEHIMKDSKSKIQGYVGVFGELDKFIGATNSVSAYGINQAITGGYENDARMVINAGFNYDMLNAGRLYFDFEKSFFGSFTIDWKVNVGYRYAFGKKEVTKTEEVKEVAPIKLKDDTAEKKEDTAEKKETPKKKTKAKKTAKVKKKDEAK